MNLSGLPFSVRARIADSNVANRSGKAKPQVAPKVNFATLSADGVCAAVLPYPPSVNRMWRNVGGRTLLSREGRAYRERVKDVCVGLRPLSGDVAVRLKLYRPRKVGDLDNAFKGVLDSLRGIAFHDDKQVIRIEAERHDDKHNPRVEVWVTAIEGPQPAARGPHA